jgi:hypothetical protein
MKDINEFYQEMKSPADNKHIGKMSAEVTTKIFACPLSVGDSPSSSAYEPTLRQYAGPLAATRASR